MEVESVIKVNLDLNAEAEISKVVFCLFQHAAVIANSFSPESAKKTGTVKYCTGSKLADLLMLEGGILLVVFTSVVVDSEEIIAGEIVQGLKIGKQTKAIVVESINFELAGWRVGQAEKNTILKQEAIQKVVGKGEIACPQIFSEYLLVAFPGEAELVLQITENRRVYMSTLLQLKSFLFGVLGLDENLIDKKRLKRVHDQTNSRQNRTYL